MIALHEVGESAKTAIDAMGLVESASIEQADFIEQIKRELSQVSSVVQTNAATAEENSATSEEMSAQAATLHQEVGRFKLKANSHKSGHGEHNELISSFKNESSTIALPGLDASGKY